MIISIIITHNGIKHIDKCFESLLKSTIPIKIFAIDNASTDGTPEIIQQRYPSVEVIQLKQNIGFGKANNIGLKRVLQENADYAFLLNQDAWVEPAAVENLIRKQTFNPQYGIISPIHLCGDKTNLDNNFTTYISGYSCPGLISDIVMGRELNDIYETNFVNAAIWLITRQVLEKVGGFDPLFFMYGEDDDYIRRVKYHDFKIGICPSSIGYHDRPQVLYETHNWPVDRIFSSKLIGIKNPLLDFPQIRHFYLQILKQILKSFIFKENSKKQIKLYVKIISMYRQIKMHHDLCKLSYPTFLVD
jgi:GT2 family glycosyltransferase